jgi:DNA-binding SARP family transcriptional activator/TolB-like protein
VHGVRVSLLILLAVERQVSRDSVVGVLCPDREPERARRSLSQALYRLRHELGEDYVLARGDVLEVSPDVACDAVEFIEAAEQDRTEAALALYQGPFMAGLRLPEANAFDDWIHHHRARLARVHRKVRRQVIESRYAAGDHAGALDATRSWAELDPYDDEAQHRLLTLLAEAGERAELLECYADYERLLREGGLKPRIETRALIEHVRNGVLLGAPDAALPALTGESAEAAREEVGAHSSADAAQRRATDTATRPGAHGVMKPASETSMPGETGAATQRGGVRGFLNELRRRRVVRVAVAYSAVAFVVLQAAGLIMPALLLPNWTFRLLVVLILLGLPVALVLAWAFDLTPDGLRRAPRSRYRWGSPTALLRGATSLLVAAVLLTAGVVLWREQPAPPDGGRGVDTARIAVLYFEDGSPDGSLAHLANGLTGDLIRELNAVPGLEVISAAGVRQFRGTTMSPDSVARVLDVGTIVNGRIEQSGDRLRVTAEIVNPATLRSHTIGPLERPEAELFQLQAELATGAANRIRRALGLTYRYRQLGAGTQVQPAWDAVQRAAHHLELARRSVEEHAGDSLAAARAVRELARSDSLLAVAEELDRDYSVPVVQRARVAADRARLIELLTDPLAFDALVGELRTGLDHAERAVARWPERADALEQRGILSHRLSRRLWGTEEAARLGVRAEQDLVAAVTADSSLAAGWAELSELLQLRGDEIGANRAAQQALKQDRFLDEAPAVMYRIFNSALHLGRWADAAEWCRTGRAEFPQNPLFYTCELLLMAFSDPPPTDADRAWQLFEEAQARTPPKLRAERAIIRELEVALVLARTGLADSARAMVSRVDTRLRRDGAPVNRSRTLYYQAIVHLRGGDSDSALALLEEYPVASPDAWPEIRTYLARDLALAPLRSDPRFQRLIGTGPPSR